MRCALCEHGSSCRSSGSMTSKQMGHSSLHARATAAAAAGVSASSSAAPSTEVDEAAEGSLLALGTDLRGSVRADGGEDNDGDNDGEGLAAAAAHPPLGCNAAAAAAAAAASMGGTPARSTPGKSRAVLGGSAAKSTAGKSAGKGKRGGGHEAWMDDDIDTHHHGRDSRDKISLNAEDDEGGDEDDDDVAMGVMDIDADDSDDDEEDEAETEVRFAAAAAAAVATAADEAALLCSDTLRRRRRTHVPRRDARRLRGGAAGQ
mmetsp:Transcript_3065/g.7047  ORF Transcript_3065/g.7047 Transcript_3065/m.7047 type:complete len:261 (-) Transcript_3065:2079-2861(-)